MGQNENRNEDGQHPKHAIVARKVWVFGVNDECREREQNNTGRYKVFRAQAEREPIHATPFPHRCREKKEQTERSS